MNIIWIALSAVGLVFLYATAEQLFTARCPKCGSDWTTKLRMPQKHARLCLTCRHEWVEDFLKRLGSRGK
jgi:hypothetical protein